MVVDLSKLDEASKNLIKGKIDDFVVFMGSLREFTNNIMYFDFALTMTSLFTMEQIINHIDFNFGEKPDDVIYYHAIASLSIPALEDEPKMRFEKFIKLFKQIRGQLKDAGVV